MATIPTGRDVKASVFRGLNLQGALTSSMVTGITFEPTVGIAAGRIALLGMELKNFREPLTKAVQQVIIPSIQKNFDEGGRPEWEPLTDFTLKRRSDGGYSEQPLVKTGKLKTTMTRSDIWTITNSMAVLADLPEEVWYGKVHQGGFEGSGTGRRVRVRGGVRRTLEHIVDKALAGDSTDNAGVPPIPARPFVTLQPEDEDKITEIFITWLGQRVVHAWPGVRL